MDSFAEEEEIDAHLAVWTWSLFPKHFSLHRQDRTKWRNVILSRLQIQIYTDKDLRATTLKTADEQKRENSF